MVKTKTLYVCQSCGAESPKWMGRCSECGEWNSLVETIVSTKISNLKSRISKPRRKAQNLSKIESKSSNRISSGIGEFDRVLGGGLIPGQVVLLAGEPGIGKSTLLLQLAAKVQNNSENGSEQLRKLSESGRQNVREPDKSDSPKVRNTGASDTLIHRGTDALSYSELPSRSEFSGSPVLYISGEESPAQIKLRANRLGIDSAKIEILTETDVDIISETVSQLVSKSAKHQSAKLTNRPTVKLIIIDSIQTLTTDDLSSGAGSIGQVRECARRLSLWAKQAGKPLILVGHITKGGAIAGPKVLEHMVDTVLTLEGDKFHTFRILRASKNRFGSATEVGVFKMQEKGLIEVPNPSDLFLAERLSDTPGSLVTVILEGTRPVLLEVQALTSKTSFQYPRRVPSGISYQRLLLLAAVLEKRLNLSLQNQDIYVNIAAGVRVKEPAVDLAVCLAIASAFKGKTIDSKVVAFGEVGLSGEVRKVAQIKRREKEAKKLGFTKIVGPLQVRSVKEALSKL